MSRTPKIDRVRRNMLKAASLVLGTVVATGFLPKLASATPGNNGNGNGGCGAGQQTNGCGGSCFVRGTQIRTREGYRPIGPTVVYPERFGDTAALIVRMFSTAHVELARIRARRRL